MRAVLLALSLLAAEPASAFCLIVCDTEFSGREAAERLAWHFGPLPKGTEVVGLLEGGFQDIYMQAHLSVDEAGLVDLLAALHVKEASLAPEDQPFLGPTAPAWFDWARQEGLRAAEGRTDWLDGITVAVAPDPETPGRWRVYLWCYVT